MPEREKPKGRYKQKTINQNEITYCHELGAGSHKLSEAEEKVLFCGQDLSQLMGKQIRLDISKHFIFSIWTVLVIFSLLRKQE